MKTIRELFDTFISINGKKRTDFSDFEKFCEKTFKEEGEALQAEALKNYTPDYTKQWNMQANAIERYKNYIVYKKLARELLLECLRSRYNDRNPFKNESMWAIENGYM